MAWLRPPICGIRARLGSCGIRNISTLPTARTLLSSCQRPGENADQGPGTDRVTVSRAPSVAGSLAPALSETRIRQSAQQAFFAGRAAVHTRVWLAGCHTSGRWGEEPRITRQNRARTDQPAKRIPAAAAPLPSPTKPAPRTATSSVPIRPATRNKLFETPSSVVGPRRRCSV